MNNILKGALFGLGILIVLFVVTAWLGKGASAQAAVTPRPTPTPTPSDIDQNLIGYNACMLENSKMAGGSPCVTCVEDSSTGTPIAGVIVGGLCVPHHR